MATDYCKYHPLTTARWHCEQCCLNVCDECAPAGGEGDNQAVCVLCNQVMHPLTAQQVEEPFWQRTTHFLQLPFTTSGLGLLSLLFVLPIFFPEALLKPVAGASYFLLAGYGWCLLQRATRGELNPVSPSVLLKGLNSLGIQIAGVIALVLLGLLWLSTPMPFLSVVLALVIAGLLPVWLMSARLEKSVTALWQPSSWLSMLQQLQFRYLPFVVIAMALVILLQAIVALLDDVLSPMLVQSVRNLTYGYGLWVMMAISGYGLYQFQQLLGFTVEGRRGARRSAIRRLDPQQARFEVLLKEGQYERAGQILRTISDKNRLDVNAQSRYFNLLIFLQDQDLVPVQGEYYMAALMAAKQNNEALQIFTKIRLIKSDFKPDSPDVVFDLARVFVEKRDYQQAADLLDGLHQTSPHFSQLPEAYMLRARLLHEKLAQSALALEVMEFLVGRFQKHPRFGAMESYWQQLGGKHANEFMM